MGVCCVWTPCQLGVMLGRSCGSLREGGGEGEGEGEGEGARNVPQVMMAVA